MDISTLLDALFEGVAEIDPVHLGALLRTRMEGVTEVEGGARVDLGSLFWARVEGVTKIKHRRPVDPASLLWTRLEWVAELPGVRWKCRVGTQPDSGVFPLLGCWWGEAVELVLRCFIGFPVERFRCVELLPLAQPALVAPGNAYTRPGWVEEVLQHLTRPADDRRGVGLQTREALDNDRPHLAVVWL